MNRNKLLNEFWNWAQSALGSTILGGLAVILLAAIVRMVWSKLKKMWLFLQSIRIITEGKLRAMEDKCAAKCSLKVEELRTENRVLAQKLNDSEERAEELRVQIDEVRLENAKLEAENLEALASQDFSESDFDTYGITRKVPMPKPRWRVVRKNGSLDEFILQNTVGRSIAKEVRLESSEFDIIDGAHWENVSGQSEVEFAANVRTGVNADKIQLNIEWYDEDGYYNTAPLQVELNPKDFAPF